VMIQVLIAEVLLTDTDEFGVELGIQDPIFFNRSENGEPGFQFVTNPTGNNTTVPGSDIIGTQALSSLGVGRTGGGLILAASSEAVSILIRALKAEGRADILGRPQVTAMDNQTAQVSVGEEVPTVTGTVFFQNTQQSVVSYQQVGLILAVRPRISPDRQVVMEIEATKSSVSEAEGITIAVADGEPIRAPRFNIATARTVISAADGQTVILGGLITKDRSKSHRRVPWLGELPLVGWAFQWNSMTERKTELLIIMTPHIIESDEDVEVIKQVETARMNWCLSDILELHGDDGIPGIAAPPADAGTTVIYPDLDPGAERVPTLAPPHEHPKPVPSPQGSPFILEPMPQEFDPGGSAPGPGPTSTIQPLRSWDASAGYVQPGPNGQAASPPGLPNDIERAVYEPYDQSPGAPAVPQSSLYAPNGWEQGPSDRERLLSNPLRDY
jgi:general secretion pathway protein D